MGEFNNLEQSTPGNPTGGRRKLYPKSDGWYELDSSGNEKKLIGLDDIPKDSESKGIIIENPVAADDLGFFFTDVAITVSKLRAVLVGSATPSVTWTIRHSTDRSAAGSEVITGGTTTTSTTTGSEDTTFDDPTIPANSWVWVEITAQSGTVTQISIDLFFDED